MTITTSPYFHDVLFITIGAKREAIFSRWIDGVAAMFDKETGEKFGYAIITGRLPTGAIELPLKAKITYHD